MVGFLLVEVDETEETFIIWRMMIDKSHQNKGYGRQAIEAAIKMARQSGKYRRIIADYVNGNDVMKRLLVSCQFQPTRYRQEYDEYEMEYIL